MSYTCGERLRECRLRAEMTQLELAEKCGLTERAIGNYERGTRVPDTKTIIKLANILKVSPFTLSEPVLDDAAGVLHILSRITDDYNLSVSFSDNSLVLDFSNTTSEKASDLIRYIKDWSSALSQLQSTSITRKYYDKWISKYPDYAEMIDGALPECHDTIINDTSDALVKHNETHRYSRK